MFWIYLISSFLIVALGQPARSVELGILASIFGFALFWRSMLYFDSPRSRFLLALLWFTGVQMIQLSWMATIQYMGPLIVAVYLFLNGALGVQFAALSMNLKPQTPIRPLQALAISGIWVLFEWTRLFPCTGFTWNPVGLTLSCSIYPLQWASLFGIYGLSFWVILTNLSALRLLTGPFSKRALSLFCLLAALPYGFGVATIHLFEEKGGPEAKAILVQTAIMPDTSIPAIEQWERILKLVRNKEGIVPDLIVLPEGALPFGAYRYGYDLKAVHRIWERYFGTQALSDFPPLDAPYVSFDRKGPRTSNAYWVQALANHYRADVVVGLDDEEYNAAFLFSPKGLSAERYEKRILVPVGEYVPFSNIRFIANFVGGQFGIHHSFNPGKEAKLFHGKIPLSVSICYEETFSEKIREARLMGADLLINITDNAWFPSSKLAQQHFDHGIIRAVENGVPVLRSCNTGITGGVDCFGRTVARLEPSEQIPEALALSIPLSARETPYTFWGDLAILILSGLFIAAFGLCKKKLL